MALKKDEKRGQESNRDPVARGPKASKEKDDFEQSLDEQLKSFEIKTENKEADDWRETQLSAVRNALGRHKGILTGDSVEHGETCKAIARFLNSQASTMNFIG